MRRLATLFLAFIAGAAAQAQQPAEWRPNIAEDNKAATWTDTSDFLRNSINNGSLNSPYLVYGRAISDEECSLEFESAFFNSNGPTFQHFKTKMNLRLVDPLSVRVIPANGSASRTQYAVMFEGAKEAAFAKVRTSMYTNGAKHNYKSAQDSLDLNCDASDNKCQMSEVQVANLMIRFSDQEFAKRFSRAVMHAALFCGGTKAVSPF